MSSRRTKRFLSQRGFTLIELLIVIAIIGILSSVILFSLNESRGHARDVKRKADLRQIQTALEIYFNENNDYPGEAGWCDSSKGVIAEGCAGYVGDSWQAGGLGALEQQGIVSKLPIDPINNDDFYYQYEPVCGQTQYGFTCATGDCCAYRLGTTLEDTNDSSSSPDCMDLGTDPTYCVGPQ